MSKAIFVAINNYFAQASIIVNDINMGFVILAETQ